METRQKDECCDLETGTSCRVEALVSVDERGQMVLPKELREKAGIRAGEKLALTTWEKDGRVCCITINKAAELTDIVRATLGPVMKELLQSTEERLK